MVEATSQSEGTVTTETFTIVASAKKLENGDDVVQAAGGEESVFDQLDKATGIKLSGNSYGYEACSFVATQLGTRDTPNLVDIDFSDIFVSRLRAELPASLEVMCKALAPK